MKKFLSKEFLFIIGNTASICILFMVMYLRRDTVELTRTFSHLVLTPITETEISEFLKTFERPKRVNIRLKETIIISNQQRFSFEIIFYDKVGDDPLAEKLKKDFEFYFQIKLIYKEIIKEKKLPQVVYDMNTGVFLVSNINGNNLKLPISISLTSTSTTPEGVKVFNAFRVENSEMVDGVDNLLIKTLTKTSKYSIENDVSLLSIRDGDNYIFLEILEIK